MSGESLAPFTPLKEVRQIPTEKLIFLDGSGMNLAMERTHAWVKRGHEYVERIPMNWDNLAAHHGEPIRAACADYGVRLLYLPPYSPDLNPIESG